jgi:hypothetical protein
MEIQTLPLGFRSEAKEAKNQYNLSIKLVLTDQELADWAGISVEHDPETGNPVLDYKNWINLPLKVSKAKKFGSLPDAVFKSIASEKGTDLSTGEEFTVDSDMKELFDNYFASSVKKPHKEGKPMKGWILSFSHPDYMPTTIEIEW